MKGCFFDILAFEAQCAHFTDTLSTNMHIPGPKCQRGGRLAFGRST